MNRIVRENYPVSKLPEDLQRKFPGQVEVTVTVEAQVSLEADALGSLYQGGHFSRFRHLARANFNNMDEVVAHLRALRDEWDERDHLITPDP